MNINEVLFSKKFRPSSLDNMVLLPRIREVVKDGIKTNLILLIVLRKTENLKLSVKTCLLLYPVIQNQEYFHENQIR